MTIYYWLILFVFLVIVEICTLQLVSLWFAVGSLVAMIVAILNGSVELQLLIFLVVSFVLLILLKPFKDKFLNKHLIKTNVDSLIGKTARVTAKIHNKEGFGAAIVNGLEWTAVAKEDEDIIEVGSYVTICDISGVKLIVESKKNTEDKN